MAKIMVASTGTATRKPSSSIATNTSMCPSCTEKKAEHFCLSRAFKRMDRITINVSGRKYEARVDTLEKYPETLLGNPTIRNRFYDPETNEYFFERPRDSFPAILEYYHNNGELIKPPRVSFEEFLEEIKFFGMGETALKRLFRDEHLFEHPVRHVPDQPLRRKLWLLFEDPQSSWAAYVVAWLNGIVVIVSIVAFCVETLPGMKRGDTFEGSIENETLLEADTSPSKFNQSDPFVEVDMKSYATKSPFFAIETACVIWVIIDLSVRFSVSITKKQFFFRIHNFVDVLSTIPYFVTVTTFIVGSLGGVHRSDALAALRIFRIVRFLRLFRVTRQWKMMQIFVLTVKAAAAELYLLAVLLVISTVILSSATYYAEIAEVPDTIFTSIPLSFYWGVITLTSTGYGDYYPKGNVGRLIACVSAVVGLILFSLSIPTVARKFEIIQQRVRKEDDLRKVLRKDFKDFEIEAYHDLLMNQETPEPLIAPQHRQKTVREIILDAH